MTVGVVPDTMGDVAPHKHAFVFADDYCLVCEQNSCLALCYNEQVVVLVGVRFGGTAAAGLQIGNGAVDNFADIRKQAFCQKINMLWRCDKFARDLFPSFGRSVPTGAQSVMKYIVVGLVISLGVYGIMFALD